MAAPKTIILARPHPFIVDDMTAFLTTQGYDPLVCREDKTLNHANATVAHGAIVSTALNAMVSYSVRETIDILHQKKPGLPIVLATLLSVELAEKQFSTTIAVEDEKLITCDRESLTSPWLGMPNGYLLLTRDDLLNNSALVQPLIERHFR
ncbi:Uncharacterised protein [BD1-7 clade bacterium]|uniref:Uncharacterized protein n=1 Tax=BD1-7 clade bacterium TaxID=2029982 RepID=A0A5S9NS68_9GAMM|nr:Uncharacterised protein [BD1-7 clade bacterium]CAA0093469.1 Uncharacterised protein [BD1-7 clade bacterium]